MNARFWGARMRDLGSEVLGWTLGEVDGILGWDLGVLGLGSARLWGAWLGLWALRGWAGLWGRA